MKMELGLGRCGLACALCSENNRCQGCDSGQCPEADQCENRACSMKKGLKGCYDCNGGDCRKGMLAKTKPLAFTLFAREYGPKELLRRLEDNEKAGVVYHRQGIQGDYDEFETAEQLFESLKEGNGM